MSENKEQVELNEVEKMQARTQAIKDRVAQMRLFHEDIIIMERIDTVAVRTFLHTDPRMRNVGIRTSWYGRIIAKSFRHSGDDIKEVKKLDLNIDDIVSYNPESAYSLNVEDFPEIWCMSIENILIVDNGFDPVKAKQEAMQRSKEIEDQHEREMQAGAKLVMEQLEMQKKRSGAVGASNIAPLNQVLDKPHPEIVLAKR